MHDIIMRDEIPEGCEICGAGDFVVAFIEGPRREYDISEARLTAYRTYRRAQKYGCQDDANHGLSAGCRMALIEAM